MYLIIQNRKKKSFFKEWMTLKKALSISYTNAFILTLHIKNNHGLVLEVLDNGKEYLIKKLDEINSVLCKYFNTTLKTNTNTFGVDANLFTYVNSIYVYPIYLYIAKKEGYVDSNLSIY